jgi:site-specific DNA-methyltransferase (adenine-specific)
MTKTLEDLKNNGVELNTIYNCDCLEALKLIKSQSIDLVLTDPPYGTTSNEWDNVVDFWSELKRICKGGFIVFSSQPYTTDLINSNRKDFKYCWIWNKEMTGNFAIAKYQPLKVHEEVCIFGDVKYNPIMRKGKARYKGGSFKGNSNTGNLKSEKHFSEDYYPTSILQFNNAGNRSISEHPTQKPVELISYLIKTYSNENDTILDPFLGSGTTAVACKQLKRNFIGIEISQKYCDIANQRLRQNILI